MVGAGRASSGTYPTRWLFDASQTVLIMHAEGRHPVAAALRDRARVLASVGMNVSAQT